MTTEMERRVGNLLDNSHGQGRDHNVSSTASVGASKQLPTSVNSTKPAYKLETDTAKDKFSAELQQKQEQMKVNLLFFCNDILSLYTCKYRVTYYALQGSDGLKAMLAFREKLPAFKVKSEFLKAMTENQVQMQSL